MCMYIYIYMEYVDDVPADLTQLSNIKGLMNILTEMNKKIDKIMKTPILEKILKVAEPDVLVVRMKIKNKNST